MSHEEKSSAGGQENVGVPKAHMKETDAGKETLITWVSALTGINHSLASAREFLAVLSTSQKEDSKKLDEIKTKVMTAHARMEQIAADTQGRCKEALEKFTKFKGAWGKIQWLVTEHKENPRGVWSAFAMMAFTVILATVAGLDVGALLAKAWELTGLAR